MKLPRKDVQANRVIIVGAGQVGSHIAEHLSNSGYNVVVIDEDEDKVREARDMADVASLVGNGCNAELYKQIGLNEADLFVAVTNSDEINLVACRIAKAFGVKSKVARVRQTFYGDVADTPIDKKFWKKFGVEVLFNQERITALEIEHLIENPGAIDTISLHNDQVQIVGYRVRKNSLLVGRRLIGLKDLPIFENLLVAAVTTTEKTPEAKLPARTYSEFKGLSNNKRAHSTAKEVTIIPRGDYKIQEGDLLYICGKTEDFGDVGELFDPGLNKDFKHLFILGGSILAHQLAEGLVKKYPKKSVYLIEKSKKSAYSASDNLNSKLHILHTDIRKLDDLKNEGLDDKCIFIGASFNEDDNVVASLIVKEETQARTIAIIQNPTYIHFVPYLDIDAAVSPKLLLVDEVLKELRQSDYDILSAKSSEAEVLEFTVQAGSQVCTKPLKQCRFPENSITVAIFRQEEIIIPDGKSELLAGDHVVVFCLKSSIEEVRALFN